MQLAIPPGSLCYLGTHQLLLTIRKAGEYVSGAIVSIRVTSSRWRTQRVTV